MFSEIQQILQDLPEAMEVAGVPGVAFSIIENCRITSAHAIGVSDSETSEPITENTVFQAGSLSKPVFAYGVLSLSQEGHIDLDTSLNDYLSLSESEELPQLKAITARQALTHTTGLQNWRFNDEDKLAFDFQPGTNFSYSGEGFFYVQRVIEQITGQSIESALQERVLRPFGMASSSYIWRAEHENRISRGHRDRGQKAEPWNAWQGRRLLAIAAKKNKPLDEWLYTDFVEALPQVHKELSPLPNNMIPNVAGSLLTTISDYAQFVLRLLDPSDEVARLMLVPQYKLNRVISWGLGIGLEKIENRTCFWHWGENGIFENFMFGDPESGSGILILTNGSRGLRICERILRELTGHSLAAFLWI